MTTYKTLNPMPSTAVFDLFDNAENFDFAMNDRERQQWLDRFGIARWTWSGLENLVTQYLDSMGYQDLGDYQAGLVISARNQIFRKDGEYWRASPALELPYTTTGVWATEASLFTGVGDAVLRQDLANRIGAALVGYSQTGPNALSRNVLQRLQDTPSSADYILNPGVDDTALLQELIDTHQYAHFVGPQNTFVIRGTLRLRNGMNLDLRGARIRQANPQAPIFDNQNNHDVSIYNGILQGAKSFVNSPSGMDIGILSDGHTNTLLRDLIMLDFGYAGWRCQVGGERTIMQNVRVRGFANELGTEDRNNMGFCLGGTSIMASGCLIENTSQGFILVEKSNSFDIGSFVIRDIPVEHGAYIDTSVRNGRFSNSIIRNVEHMGAKVQWYDAGDFGTPENIAFDGLTIYGCGDTCLAMLNSQPTSPTPLYARNMSITNCTFAEGQTSGVIARYVQNLKVSNNNGYSLGGTGMSIAYVLSGDVSSNQLTKVQGIGVEAYGDFFDVKFADNKLHNVGLIGEANPAQSFGMSVVGGARAQILRNDVTSDTFNMAYGIFVELPTNVGSRLVDNFVRGYYTAGYRLSAARDPFTEYRNNKSLGRDHNDAVVNMPNTGPMEGDGGIREFANAGIPTSGIFLKGDCITHPSPDPGQPSRWRCVQAGDAADPSASGAKFRVETTMAA